MDRLLIAWLWKGVGEAAELGALLAGAIPVNGSRRAAKITATALV